MEERNLITVTFVDSREINEDEMEEDEDIDQDDEDFDFSADGLKTQLPRKQIVKIMILDTKQIVEVKCRLLWTWKWMQVKKFIHIRRKCEFNVLISFRL